MTALHLIRQPYRGEHGTADWSGAPDYVDDDALQDSLREIGIASISRHEVALTADENRQYGQWRRVAHANAHLARHVASAVDAGALAIGLLANCNSLPGMLAGLQRVRGEEARVGLVWIDAHADFNTAETTLSGMLGGMPVALACGLCLHRLREVAGMRRPIDPADVLMLGLRDVDPLEQELLDANHVRCFDLEPGAAALERISEVNSLAERVDSIYIHIDMDVLRPEDVPGHPLTVPGGPDLQSLAIHLAVLVDCDKVEAVGIASVPPQELDPDGRAKASAHELLRKIAGGYLLR